MRTRGRLVACALGVLFPAAAWAGKDDLACPSDTIKRTAQTKKESLLYLVKDTSKVPLYERDVLAIHQTVSARQQPSHRCLFTSPDSTRQYQEYAEGRCTNLRSGRTTSIFGGAGIRVRDDGSAEPIESGCKGIGDACAFLEDANQNRLMIDNYNGISRALSWSGGEILSNCKTGRIEAVRLLKALPGYIIIERSVETGFIDTFRPAPAIQF